MLRRWKKYANNPRCAATRDHDGKKCPNKYLDKCFDKYAGYLLAVSLNMISWVDGQLVWGGATSRVDQVVP
jgi:hypothetical protein